MSLRIPKLTKTLRLYRNTLAWAQVDSNRLVICPEALDKYADVPSTAKRLYVTVHYEKPDTEEYVMFRRKPDWRNWSRYNHNVAIKRNTPNARWTHMDMFTEFRQWLGEHFNATTNDVLYLTAEYSE